MLPDTQDNPGEADGEGTLGSSPNNGRRIAQDNEGNSLDLDNLCPQANLGGPREPPPVFETSLMICRGA